ncbi:efflux RND transporter periplasmic adaptor subunit [Verrucomicrobiota bacterium sgz303538]
MKRLLAAALLSVITISASPSAYSHEGHVHGAGPGTEAMATGPITLTEEALKNLGIQTVEANLAPLQRSLEMAARIEGLPERQAKISPLTNGRVSEILVKLGDKIKAGQPVLRFEPLTVGNPPVVLKSPIDGYVIRQNASIAQPLTPETVLMEVADYSQVLVRGATFENPDLTRIEPGQSARVRVDIFPNEVFEGKVQRLDVGLEAQSRTFEAYVLLDNPELKLRPNMQATVFIGLGEPQEVLAVPERAILGDTGNLFVFVQDGTTFERRNVVRGIKAGDQVEILEGVLPGDKVVVQGNYQLQYATGKPKPAENHTANDPAHAEGASTSLSEHLQHAGQLFTPEHLPAWGWGIGGFALGAFLFGFLLRRTA